MMFTKRVFGILVLVLALILPSAPAQAALFPVEKSRAGQAPPVPAAPGTPDGFGYTWDDSEPFNWIDTSAGTDSGFAAGSPSLFQSASINLPFSFKYYENSYDTLHLTPWGYLSFTNYANWFKYKIGYLPDPLESNNLIAPYWTDVYLGPGAWVHSLTGGTAPDRYFVAEWHDLNGAAPSDLTGSDETYRFETILYENGDIVFQYANMSYAGEHYCGVAGIENAAGQDGLDYLGPCAQAASNRAVRFTRPAAAARAGFTPLRQATFVSPGSSKTFNMAVSNTGDLGADTFDLSASSVWPVTFYAADGLTLLGDTDGDTTVDTGLLASGASVSIVVRLAVPTGLAAGTSVTALIAANSSINLLQAKTTALTMTVPASFAGVFMQADYTMDFLAATPAFLNTYNIVANNNPGYGVALTQTTGGSYLYVWVKFHLLGSSQYANEAQYAIVGQDGSLIHPVSLVAERFPPSQTIYATSDGGPTPAVVPDGHMAIALSRLENDPIQGLSSSNLYFVVLDSLGNPSYGPLNITNHALGSAERISSLSLAATDDNRFVLVWQVENPNTPADNLWYAVYDSSGAVVLPPAALTLDNVSSHPVLNSLPGGKVLLTSQKSTGGPYYTVLGSSGAVLKAETNLNSPGALDTADAVALPGGRLAIAWNREADIELCVMDASFNAIAAGPLTAGNAYTALGNTALSATTDLAGHVILTWSNLAYPHALMYALADNTGSFITAPQPFLEASNPPQTSLNGQGNAPLTRFGDVSPTFWAARWIEALANAGVTSGCAAGRYCPSAAVTRAQMAVFLLKAKGITPPPATGTKFTDVPASYWAAAWIEELANQGITSGCGANTFCPDGVVTRDQMAVLLLKAKGITPPAATGTKFTDVPLGYWAGAWIEELASQNITAGCGANTFCPTTQVTRDQMAVFLVKAFNLPLP